ncbi:MAG TPA: ABC transporter substrate-binding protein [Candidatus Lustribacter sp.]|jgi:branched-chain amino acid transport system substrate-binding protein|nr:ABC transporter substrate-binding protein [Candidatus Lustribacter sp.]
MNVSRSILAAFALVLTTLSAPAARAATPTGPPIEIQAILSLTGAAAFLGKSEQSALALTEDQVNRSGGIAGRPIKFIVQDDQTNPQVAVQLFNGLTAKGVPLVIGPTLTGSCGAIAALVKDGPLVYCLSPGFHPDKGTWSFSWGPITTDLIAINIRYYRELGFKKLALLTSTDASGQDGEHGVDAALALPENKDVTLVAREHYAVSDLSVAAQISRIKESGAQAMIAWGTGAPIGTVFHGVSDGGLDIPVGVSASNLLYTIMKQYGAFLPKQLVSAGFGAVAYDSLPNGAVKNAVRQYVDAFKAVGVRADASQVIAWDPAWIVISAYKKLGPNATAAQLKDYISNLRGYAGATGMYDFTDVPQRGVSGMVSGIMVQWDPAKDTFVAISKFGGLLR